MITLSKNINHRECISVVIPTMLLAPRDIFSYTLEQLNSNDLVKEIIIIDNTRDKDFDKQYSVTPKTRILKLPGNQGASYNAGMKECKTEYYLLINDDVACRSSIIDSCFDIMEHDKEIGLLQIDTMVSKPLNVYLETIGEPQTRYMLPSNPRACMTGWFQFGRTEDWIEIPKELRYFYGDDLLLEIMKHKKKKVARIVSDKVSHMVSSTVGRVVKGHTIYEEQSIYHNILKRMFNK